MDKEEVKYMYYYYKIIKWDKFVNSVETRVQI